MDAITMLRDDHETVKRQFRAFERLDDDDTASRRKLVDEMIRELSVHAYIEEQVVSPDSTRLRSRGRIARRGFELRLRSSVRRLVRWSDRRSR